MNIKKIEKQLKKVNQLFDAIKEDGTITAIEKDLMLSYIRTLYEKVALPQKESSHESSSKEATAPKSESTKAEKVSPPVTNIADVVMQEVIDAAPTPAVQKVTAPKETVTAQATLVETSAPEVETPEPEKPQAPQELVDLFKYEAINELSDKLGRSPIPDLTKCMGINEKIFTVQELFGGDSTLFTESMQILDKYKSLDEAKDYLIENVALKNNWTAEGKVKKAANFIKLISRRY